MKYFIGALSLSTAILSVYQAYAACSPVATSGDDVINCSDMSGNLGALGGNDII